MSHKALGCLAVSWIVSRRIDLFREGLDYLAMDWDKSQWRSTDRNVLEWMARRDGL